MAENVHVHLWSAAGTVLPIKKVGEGKKKVCW